MNRLTRTLALALMLGGPALAQGDEPPPRKPPRGGEEERRRLEEERTAMMAEMARVKAELAAVEEKAAAAKAEGRSDEAAELAARAEELRRMAKATEARLRDFESFGPGGPPRRGGEPGGPDGPGRPPMGPDGRGPMGPDGRGPMGPKGPPPTQEDYERALAYMKDNEPERFAKLTAIQKEHPEEYKRILAQLAWEIRELSAMKEADPARYQRRVDQRRLENRSRELAEKFRGAKQEQEKEAIAGELREVVGKLFDLREADKESELKRLEDEIARLKETMKKRKDSKDKIVDRRVEELTGEDEDLGW